MPPRWYRKQLGQLSANRQAWTGHANAQRSRHQSSQRPLFSDRQEGQNRDRPSRKKSIDSVEEGGSPELSVNRAWRTAKVIAAMRSAETPVALEAADNCGTLRPRSQWAT